jgi:hypothetical protein
MINSLQAGGETRVPRLTWSDFIPDFPGFGCARLKMKRLSPHGPADV